MKNRIASLLFDRNSFPISPDFDTWAAYEINGRILFAGLNAPEPEQNFNCLYTEEQQAWLPKLPEGDYKLIVSIPDQKSPYKISFSIFPLEGGIEIDRVLFDAKGFFEDYGYAFAKASENLQTEAEKAEFEARFSIDYLKKSLGSVIEGNTDFWERLSGDLDMATTPLNIGIARQLNGLPALPVEVVRHIG